MLRLTTLIILLGVFTSEITAEIVVLNSEKNYSLLRTVGSALSFKTEQLPGDCDVYKVKKDNVSIAVLWGEYNPVPTDSSFKVVCDQRSFQFSISKLELYHSGNYSIYIRSIDKPFSFIELIVIEMTEACENEDYQSEFYDQNLQCSIAVSSSVKGFLVIDPVGTICNHTVNITGNISIVSSSCLVQRQNISNQLIKCLLRTDSADDFEVCRFNDGSQASHLSARAKTGVGLGIALGIILLLIISIIVYMRIRGRKKARRRQSQDSSSSEVFYNTLTKTDKSKEHLSPLGTNLDLTNENESSAIYKPEPAERKFPRPPPNRPPVKPPRSSNTSPKKSDVSDVQYAELQKETPAKVVLPQTHSEGAYQLVSKA